MSSIAFHTPEADLYEDRSGAVPPIAETLAPTLGRDAETAGAAFRNAAAAHLQTWSAQAVAAPPAGTAAGGAAAGRASA